MNIAGATGHAVPSGDYVTRASSIMRAATAGQAAALSRIRAILSVADEDIASWLEPGGKVRPSSVFGGQADVALHRLDEARMRSLDRLAGTFVEVLVPDAVLAVFSARPVPLLAMRTYREALEDGADPDVLTDILRRGGGLRPVTAAGARFLASSNATYALTVRYR